MNHSRYFSHAFSKLFLKLNNKIALNILKRQRGERQGRRKIYGDKDTGNEGEYLSVSVQEQVGSLSLAQRKDQVPRQWSFSEREGFTARQPSKEMEARLRSVSPVGF